jgi:hypothetical protein
MTELRIDLRSSRNLEAADLPARWFHADLSEPITKGGNPEHRDCPDTRDLVDMPRITTLAR